MTLTLTFGRFKKNKKCKVSWVCRIDGKKIILIGAKLWPVGCVTDKQTNRQTDRQTNGTDQYTLRKRPSGFRKVMKSAQRAGTLRNGVAVTDADVVTGYASQRLLWIGIVTDTECKPLTFGLFDNVACLNDSDADMDTDTCTDSLPQFIWCWLKVKLWPGHMCTKFQINRSTIDDFRNSEKCQLSLTSRDEKTWLRTSTGGYFRSGFRQRTSCNQLEVSTTSD